MPETNVADGTRGNYLRTRIAELESQLGVSSGDVTSDHLPGCPSCHCIGKTPPDVRSGDDKEPFSFIIQSSQQTPKNNRITETPTNKQATGVTTNSRVTELEISSPALRDWLKETLTNYPFHNYYNRLSFQYPYVPLIHNWGLLAEKAKTLEQSCIAGEINQPHSHLVSLMDAISTNLESKSLATYFSSREYHMQQRTITWETLWTIFPPGTLVYGRPFLNEDQVFIVCSLPELSFPEFRQNSWSLYCWTFDWDGEAFRKKAIELKIERFDSVKAINSLPYYPLSLYQDEVSGQDDHLGSLKTKLVKRGQKFKDICTMPQDRLLYRYKGEALCSNLRRDDREVGYQSRRVDYAKPVPKLIDDILIVDFASWIECVGPDPPCGTAKAYLDETACLCPDCRRNPTLNALFKFDWDGILVDVEGYHGKGSERNNTKALDDLQYMLFPPRVLSFAIQNKLWVQASVDQLRQERQYRESEWIHKFEILQLDQDTKDVLRGLVQYHGSKKAGSRDPAKDLEDFIPGKGAGLVILLHGPPGVGKTLTAETVALVARKPLLTVGLSDTGTDALRIEANLRRIFKVASNLNAVLLIDEADIFLESRTSDRIEGNAIVAVFLRVLEYYQGILIMTTNRVTSFDGAILSRINISITYRELDLKQRKNIYMSFLKQLDRKDLVENLDDLKDWVEEDGAHDALNGRDIRNIMCSAVALARSTGRQIRPSNLAKVQQITRQFILQMEGITNEMKSVNQVK